MPKGKCPHGEFELTEGCPQCIADRMGREGNTEEGTREALADVGATTNIVKVNYFSESTGELSQRAYTYYSEDQLKVGDVVMVPVSAERGDFPEDRLTKAKVSAINVPESKIAAYKDKVKTIPTGSFYKYGTEATLVILDDPTEAEQVEAAVIENYPPSTMGISPPAITPRWHDEDIVERLTKDAGTNEVEGEVKWELSATPRMVDNPVIIQLFEEVSRIVKYAPDRVIQSPEDEKMAMDDLGAIKVAIKTHEAEQKKYTGPLNEAHAKVIAHFKPSSDQLQYADKITRKQVLEYQAGVRAKIAEAERIEAARLKLAQEEMELKGEHTQDLTEIEKPEAPPQIIRSTIATGSKRETWKAEVIDFALLSDDWKLANQSLLDSHARTTKGERPIPGVRFYKEEGLQVRTTK